MHYDEVVSMMFDAEPLPGVPVATVAPSPARALRDAIEPLAMHAVWSPQTNGALAELGLDFFGAYVWGRAAALGTPAPSTVAATFGVFEPALIAGVYRQAADAVDRDTLLATRTAATSAGLAETLTDADLDQIGEVADALLDAVASADGSGRPLFAGLRDQPTPDDPIGRLWRACDLAREHRGDGHVAVWTARDLDPVSMNLLTERWLGMPLRTYSTTRFWPEDRIELAVDELRRSGLLDGDDLTERGRGLRQEIEDDTDRLDASVVGALGDRFDAVVERCSNWSATCVAARRFPPDPYKRAAG